MTDGAANLGPLSGRFWRTVFAADLDALLHGARSAEGRYHHDGQWALYLSPTPEASRFAVDAYLRPGDPPRVIAPLHLSAARIVDMRAPEVHRSLALTGAEAGTPWQPERAAGRPATSWIASDAARRTGADGMIYAARTNPLRWHVVLFRWNEAGAAQISPDGPPIPF